MAKANKEGKEGLFHGVATCSYRCIRQRQFFGRVYRLDEICELPEKLEKGFEAYFEKIEKEKRAYNKKPKDDDGDKDGDEA